MEQFALADSETVIDNHRMVRKTPTVLPYPFMRRVEHWCLSLGMSVIAYLLERVILRSITNSETKH